MAQEQASYGESPVNQQVQKQERKPGRNTEDPNCDIEVLHKRYESLKGGRSSIEEVWDEITRYVAPHRGRFFDQVKDENTVDWNNYHLFDSTAVLAAHTLSASIQGSLVSPSTQWFYLNYKDKRLKTSKNATTWLESCEKLVFDALQESNFNQEVAETLQELASYHTGVLTHEWDEGDAQMVFKALPIKECFFEFNHKDQVMFFTRIVEWTVAKIVDKFGEDCVPEDVLRKYNNPSLKNDRLTVAFAVWERPHRKDIDTSLPLAPEVRPYGYRYYLPETKQPLGDVGGYYEMPVYIPRWEKTPESNYGHGPSNYALPDIKMLNTLVQMTMTALDKAIDPVTIGTQRGVIGDLDLSAGGHTTVRDINEIKVLESAARFDVAAMSKGDLQRSIRQAYRIDELELKDSPAMTATEVRVRYELMQRLLGPTMGRLSNDLFSLVVYNSFAMMFRNGRLDQVPQEVSEANAELKIEYVGPLAKAQKTDQAATTFEWVMAIMNTAQAKPEILDNIDFDEFARLSADMRGVPTDIIKSVAEVKKLREMRARMQAEMAQAQLQQQQGLANKASAEGDIAMQEADPDAR